jgi:hypothetical protein
MSVVLIYKNDDAAYEAWYDAHHGSYAVNVHPGGTLLHRIPCRYIGRESTRPEHLLTANRKVCSESRGALLELAPEFGWRLEQCMSCKPYADKATLHHVSADEWVQITGMPDHVSVSLGK